MAGILDELAHLEGMGEPASETESGPLEVRSFTFDHNQEGELPVDAPIEQTFMQIIEEVVPVEHLQQKQAKQPSWWRVLPLENK